MDKHLDKHLDKYLEVVNIAQGLHLEVMERAEERSRVSRTRRGNPIQAQTQILS